MKFLKSASLAVFFYAASAQAVLADDTVYIEDIVEKLQISQFIANGITQDGELALIKNETIISDASEDSIESYYMLDAEPASIYIVSAVCDDDCGDIDLEVKSPSGESLSQDIEADNEPTATFMAGPDPSYYRIDLKMVTCSAATCFYGVSIVGVDSSE